METIETVTEVVADTAEVVGAATEVMVKAAPRLSVLIGLGAGAAIIVGAAGYGTYRGVKYARKCWNNRASKIVDAEPVQTDEAASTAKTDETVSA